jgi:hypothetical protein
MATVVCVLDRDDWAANTDNIIVADPVRRLLLWVPRDIWCPSLKDRINKAFARGGHELLHATLGELGIDVTNSLCLRRKAVERALEGLAIIVPVTEPLDLLYPLTPLSRIEDGRKVVRFRPPAERLEGERIHQWIGARRALSGKSGDLLRIGRQHIFVRRLLQAGFDFRRALADPELASMSSTQAITELGAVRSSWRFATLDAVRPAVIHGKEVLLRPGAVTRWLAAGRVFKTFACIWKWLRGWVLGRILVVPSGGAATGGKRVRLLALVAVRNEMGYLPGFIANVSPQVDGIVALDDGSTDGSGDFLRSQPGVLEVLSVPADRPYWDEVGNFQKLHAAALRHGAGWIVAMDADERLERNFRDRAERVIRRGGRLGLQAFSVKLRELWDMAGAFRVDGVWGQKRIPRLFAARPDHQFDFRPLHAVKAPLQARVAGHFITADLEFYHLRSLRREDRESRRDRYQDLDPDAFWQPGVGYDYLTDERGLRLRQVDIRRKHLESGRGDQE